MNKFISEILKETKEINDDPFFQPKDIQKRNEEERKKRKEILSKIEIGLQNIKIFYENKNYNSEEEGLFLEIFSKLHVNKRYDKRLKRYFLKDESDINICFFDLKNDVFWSSYDCIWKILVKKFHWKYDEIQYFMKVMLNEHFKLNKFTPRMNLWTGFVLLKKYNDPFFQPKIKMRNEEKKKIKREFLFKIKSGLLNIRMDYRNKKWNSKGEKLFLKIFLELHLDRKYDKKRKGYLLKNENNENVCSFDLKNGMFWISYYDIWRVFENNLRLNFNETQSFMKNMLEKHLKLYDFAPYFPFEKSFFS